MKTVKILNILAAGFGILFLVSTLAVMFLMPALKISTESVLGLVIMSCFAFSWLIAFVLGYEASEREIKIIRGY